MSSLYNQHRQGSQLTENPFSRGSKEVGRNAFLYDSSPPPKHLWDRETEKLITRTLIF